jgi:MFS transporter, DHA2 family, multidrug resistance protein
LDDRPNRRRVETLKCAHARASTRRERGGSLAGFLVGRVGTAFDVLVSSIRRPARRHIMADTSPVQTERSWRPKANPWLIAVVVALGAFMEVLDTGIANVALPYMAGSLGATTDQSTWVLTSYLVSNAIVLPISGWFVRLLGRRRFFIICLSIFTVSSLLCGIAPSLGAMIAFRVLQGAGGGGLQPMAQAILADTFPPQQRGIAFALFGVTVVVAPILGPTLGGWITDNYTWRWIFLINLPVGIMTIFLVYRLVEDPPWNPHFPKGDIRIDYVGVALLVLGVGALQIMLDKGQELDWFSSHVIVTLAVVAVCGLASLVIWEWFHKDPIVDVQLFRNLNFLSANAMMFVAGIMLFSSLVMMPQFLQILLGYSSESAGLVLSGGGILLLILMPIVGTLSTRVPARYIIAAGWLITCGSMYYSAQHLNLDISFWHASALRVLQVAGLPLLFVPIILVSYIGLPASKSNEISGLVSFMRNIGSGIGTSMVTTLLARHAQVHQVYLTAHTPEGGAAYTEMVSALTARLAVSGAEITEAAHQAEGLVYQAVIAQATMLAYVDTFKILAAGAGVMFVLSFGLQKNEPRSGPAPQAH